MNIRFILLLIFLISCSSETSSENFNANNFALDALDKGASYSVIDDKSISLSK